MAAERSEQGVIQAWFFLLGTGSLVLSVFQLVQAPFTPWLVLEAPLHLVGVAVGGGLLYSGIRLDHLLDVQAKLPQFLLKVMIGVWLVQEAVEAARHGPAMWQLGNLVVHGGLLAYLLWKFSRYQANKDRVIALPG